MQQKKWHQQEIQVTGIQITPPFLAVPTLGSSVVGSVALVLTPARSSSATAMVLVPAVTTRLALCLAFWTDEVSGSFGTDEGQIVI